MIIRQVSANDPRFKGNRVTFQPGLNVVLADRHQQAKDQDTTNGAGKTTLLETIQYCLGKDVARDKQSIFKEPKLLGWEFTLTLQYQGKDIRISRPVGDRTNITIESPVPLPGFPELSEDGCATLSRAAFTERAGPLFFSLPEDPPTKYHPKFRALMAYRIRVGKDAYHRPFVNDRKQTEWDQQVCTTFFLRLNPSLAGRWQLIRDQHKRLQVLKDLAKGDDPKVKTTRAALFAKVTRLKAQVEKEEHALRTFRVHEQYSQLEARANDLTEEIHRLVNDNILDAQLRRHYEETAIDESSADSSQVEAIYQELGVVFPEQVKKHLENVQAFHEAVVVNRRNFVRRETSRLRDTIASRRAATERLTEERARIMTDLETYGALTDFAALQKAHAATLASLHDAEREYHAKVELEEGTNELKRAKTELLALAETDRREREHLLEEALLFFSQNSAALYPEPGDLLVDINESGYHFDIQIERERSQGVGNMMIFCYDLMLMQLPRTGRFPKFLVHDSLLFDGVDFRQRAKALELAARESQRLGFQYICTLNRDDVPWNDFSPGFAEEFQSAIRLELSDQADGGLLGFQLSDTRDSES